MCLPPTPSPPSTAISSGIMAFTSIITLLALVTMLVLGFILCSIISRRQSPLPAPSVQEEQGDNGGEQQLPSATAAGLAATAGLPSFAYTQALKQLTGGDAATCSVCLGALEVGETVRLLPVCVHLFHAECIDPWLNTHSTCPICRSSVMEEKPLPPV